MNISPKLLNLIVCFPGFVSWFGSKSAIFTTRGLCIQFDPHWDPLTVLVVGSQDAPGSPLIRALMPLKAGPLRSPARTGKSVFSEIAEEVQLQMLFWYAPPPPDLQVLLSTGTSQGKNIPGWSCWKLFGSVTLIWI